MKCKTSDKAAIVVESLNTCDECIHDILLRIDQHCMERPRKESVKEILKKRRSRLLIQLSVHVTLEERKKLDEAIRIKEAKVPQKVTDQDLKELEDMKEMCRQMNLKLETLKEQKKRKRLLQWDEWDGKNTNFWACL